MEIFIPNTKKRYSINDKGVVFSNYRFNKAGKKTMRRRIVKKFMNSRYGKSSSFVECVGNKNKIHTLNSLMVRLFKIKKPDNYHHYDIISKDSNMFNNSVRNIGFKIRTEADSNYDFYPQPFYDKYGKIIKKICACCGIKKPIEDFGMNKKGDFKTTYRNITDSCRGKKQWKSIKKDTERLEKVYNDKKKWTLSPSGVKYRKKYNKDVFMHDRENLTPHYIASCLKIHEEGLKQSDLTPQLIELGKKRILLTRKIKTQKNETKTN